MTRRKIQVHDRSSRSEGRRQSRANQAINAYSPDRLKSIAWSSFVRGTRAGVDQPAIVPLDNQRSEDAGSVGARVNSDPIWVILHFSRDGVAVNDDEAMIGFVQ